jgi:hypothetical protein
MCLIVVPVRNDKDLHVKYLDGVWPGWSVGGCAYMTTAQEASFDSVMSCTVADETQALDAVCSDWRRRNMKSLGMIMLAQNLRLL